MTPTFHEIKTRGLEKLWANFSVDNSVESRRHDIGWTGNNVTFHLTSFYDPLPDK